MGEAVKQCPACGIEKMLTEEYFYFMKDKDKFSKICKECRTKAKKQYNEENKEAIKIYNKIYYEENKESINNQNRKYYEENKKNINERRKLRYKKNKKKINELQKLRYEKNKEKILAKQKCLREKNQEKIKQRRKKNKEKIKEYNRQYREKNKEKIKGQQKQYREENYRINKSKTDLEIFDETAKKCSYCKEEKPRNRKYWMRHSGHTDGIGSICKQCTSALMFKRMSLDLNFKLKHDISRTIWKSIKKNNSSKQGLSILKKLPYTIQQLRDHLESLWEPWMSWDNYGMIDLTRDTWQIDHVIPQFALPYDSMDHPNFLKCWDLNNLRPIRAIDNLKKGSKIIL